MTPHALFAIAVAILVLEVVAAVAAWLLVRPRRERPYTGPTPGPGTIWRHRKGGLYRVVDDNVYYEPTAGRCVLYVEQRPRRKRELTRFWVRPIRKFMDGRFQEVKH